MNEIQKRIFNETKHHKYFGYEELDHLSGIKRKDISYYFNKQTKEGSIERVACGLYRAVKNNGLIVKYNAILKELKDLNMVETKDGWVRLK